MNSWKSSIRHVPDKSSGMRWVMHGCECIHHVPMYISTMLRRANRKGSRADTVCPSEGGSARSLCADR
ncbi:hypothetical protein Mapa_011148 [Marchantia paleacea]|nr:hypothetical protein Mapa_011148 [Marchantia paleacea]